MGRNGPPPVGPSSNRVGHIGCSLEGNPLEARCTCPKAACGLVIDTMIDPNCDYHGPYQPATVRQFHWDYNCAITHSSPLFSGH